jgi:hypothetical protein
MHDSRVRAASRRRAQPGEVRLSSPRPLSMPHPATVSRPASVPAGPWPSAARRRVQSESDPVRVIMARGPGSRAPLRWRDSHRVRVEQGPAGAHCAGLCPAARPKPSGTPWANGRGGGAVTAACERGPRRGRLRPRSERGRLGQEERSGLRASRIGSANLNVRLGQEEPASGPDPEPRSGQAASSSRRHRPRPSRGRCWDRRPGLTRSEGSGRPQTGGPGSRRMPCRRARERDSRRRARLTNKRLTDTVQTDRNQFGSLRLAAGGRRAAPTAGARLRPCGATRRAPMRAPLRQAAPT